MGDRKPATKSCWRLPPSAGRQGGPALGLGRVAPRAAAAPRARHTRGSLKQPRLLPHVAQVVSLLRISQGSTQAAGQLRSFLRGGSDRLRSSGRRPDGPVSALAVSRRSP